MTIYTKGVKNGEETFSKYEGHTEEEAKALLADLGATGVQVISEEEFNLALKAQETAKAAVIKAADEVRTSLKESVADVRLPLEERFEALLSLLGMK